MLRIRRGDTVYVLAGKDRGKTGKVISILAEGDFALIEGVNFIKKHMRRTSQEQQGGIIQMEAPVHISNLAVYCKHCSRPTRISVSALKDGTKSRFCRKCKEAII